MVKAAVIPRLRNVLDHVIVLLLWNTVVFSAVLWLLNLWGRWSLTYLFVSALYLSPFREYDSLRKEDVFENNRLVRRQLGSTEGLSFISANFSLFP